MEDDRLLKGDLDQNLPEKTASEIRILLSSPLNEFQLERNYLIENVYDSLTEFCKKEYNKDLKIIDMMWGFDGETFNEEQTTEICLNEVDNAKKVSIGPDFVAFLCQRNDYGYLMPVIEKIEFDLISKASKPIKFKSTSNLLSFCYKLDENGVDKQKYKLKSVHEIINALKIDRDEWKKEEKELIKCVREAVKELVSQQQISEDIRDSYFVTPTEIELQKGLLNELYPNSKCLAFLRHSTDETKDLLEENDPFEFLLKKHEKDIKGKLSQDNIFEFKVNLSGSTDEINEYLQKFSKNFEDSIKRLISKNVESSQQSCLYDTEILHHALFCKNLEKQAFPRPGLVDAIKKYIDDEANNKPFIITGQCGSGKSTILSYMIRHLKKADDVFIYRFMGTSRESSNIKSVFRSILSQLDVIYGKNEDNECQNKNENLVDIKIRFEKKLQEVSQQFGKQKRLVIVLDSIDQLSKHDYRLEWFSYNLPKYVKMIYSVIPDYHEILRKIKRNLDYEKSNYLELNQLNISEARSILNERLEKCNRKLTGSITDKGSQTQWSNVNNLLSDTNNIYPLHVKLIFDIIKTWSSWYIVEEEFFKCTSITDTIKYMFKKYEQKHGKMLFSRIVFYLTLFEYNGISESELEDIVSIDDDVLNSVYLQQHPPVRRFQVALWLKIKHDIREYLTAKESNGVPVISWFHRSFIEASQNYYEDMFKQSDLKDSLLANVIDYFTEKYNEKRSDGSNGEKKPFEYKSGILNGSKKIEKIDETKHQAYRYTKSEKIRDKQTTETEEIILYNRRKLNELVNLISQLQDSPLKVELLKKHVYFNYAFVTAKCELQELDFIFEMDYCITKLVEQSIGGQELAELNDIHEIYKKLYQRLINDPNLLNYEVLSRLESRSEYVKAFAKPSGLMLVKNSICNEFERLRDIFVVNSHSKITKFYKQHNGYYLFIESQLNDNQETSLHVIELKTTRLIGTLDFKMNASSLQIILNNQHSDYVNQLSDLNICVYYFNSNTIYSCNFVNDITIIKEFDFEINSILALNSNYLLFSSETCLFGLNLNDYTQVALIEEKGALKDKDDKIQFIESTIPKETVFSSSYLSDIDYVTVCVGLAESKCIKVYKFNCKENNISLVCNIKSVKWDYFGLNKWYYPCYKSSSSDQKNTWRDSVIVDESLLIDKHKPDKSDNVIVRFVVEERKFSKENNVGLDCVVKVVEVINDGTFDVIEIDDKTRNLDYLYCNEEAHLEGFINNKIILKWMNNFEDSDWCFYIYDIAQRSGQLENYYYNYRIHLVHSDDLLVTQWTNHFHVIKIDKSKNYKLFSHEPDKFDCKVKYNEIKSEMKVIDGKLLKIEPNNRLSIHQIIYNVEEKEDPNKIPKDVYVESVKRVIDTNHVVIEQRCGGFTGDYDYGLRVVDIIQNAIVHNLPGRLTSMESSDAYETNYRILDCTENYMVTISYSTKFNSQSPADLCVYKFEREQFSDKRMGCRIDDTNPDKVFLKIYSSNDIQISTLTIDKNDPKINSYEYLSNEEKQNSKLEIKEQDTYVVPDGVDSKFISASIDQKYLIIFTKSHELLVFKLKNGQKIAHIKLNADIKGLKATDRYICVISEERTLVTFEILDD